MLHRWPVGCSILLALVVSACVPIVQCDETRDYLARLTPPTLTPLQTRPVEGPEPIAPQPRFGVGAPTDLSPQVAAWLGVSWYINWQPYEWSASPAIEFWPTVRLSQSAMWPDPAEIVRLAGNRPGATWIIGNEPDVVCWQDDLPPRQYAMAYHVLYTLIKGADPTARIAIAGVAQPSELRLRYLDQVLDNYHQLTGHPMPVDVWTVHAYILNEQRDSWGTGIPSGFSDAAGQVIEIDQHDDMDILRQRIWRFRQWMAQRGYRDRELAITEYGIIMPPDYGFDAERLRRFMWATFDYFLTATDAGVGMPADDNRLVQRWAWFSTSYWLYPAGDLVDPATGQLTQAGRDFAEYVRRWKEGGR